MKIIIGLGNPGKKFEKTRHNVGFIIIDKLYNDLRKQKYEFTNFNFSAKHNANIAESRINDEKILLVKPQTYMNESGKTAHSLIQFYKVNAENDLIVIYDDIDLPIGDVRTSGSSSGGHKGMQSIINQIGTSNIKRIRVGILGKPKDKIKNTAQYVLNNFTRSELKKISIVNFGICSVIKEFLK